MIEADSGPVPGGGRDGRGKKPMNINKTVKGILK
jgi:hypothetical protein